MLKRANLPLAEAPMMAGVVHYNTTLGSWDVVMSCSWMLYNDMGSMCRALLLGVVEALYAGLFRLFLELVRSASEHCTPLVRTDVRLPHVLRSVHQLVKLPDLLFRHGVELGGVEALASPCLCAVLR